MLKTQRTRDCWGYTDAAVGSQPRAQGRYVFANCSPVVMPLASPCAAGAAPAETTVASSAAAKTATPNERRLGRILCCRDGKYVCTSTTLRRYGKDGYCGLRCFYRNLMSYG